MNIQNTDELQQSIDDAEIDQLDNLFSNQILLKK